MTPEMKFCIVIRRQKKSGFRNPKWKVHLDWIYEKLGDALDARDKARKDCPAFEFDVLHCLANGPKYMRGETSRRRP